MSHDHQHQKKEHRKSSLGKISLVVGIISGVVLTAVGVVTCLPTMADYARTVLTIGPDIKNLKVAVADVTDKQAAMSTSIMSHGTKLSEISNDTAQTKADVGSIKTDIAVVRAEMDILCGKTTAGVTSSGIIESKTEAVNLTAAVKPVN